MLEGLLAYAGIAFFWALGALVFGNCTDSMIQKRMLARGAFLAPIWPVVIVTLVSRAIAKLWRTADWKSL
jgi:hypothetical protein